MVYAWVYQCFMQNYSVDLNPLSKHPSNITNVGVAIVRGSSVARAFVFDINSLTNQLSTRFSRNQTSAISILKKHQKIYRLRTESTECLLVARALFLSTTTPLARVRYRINGSLYFPCIQSVLSLWHTHIQNKLASYSVQRIFCALVCWWSFYASLNKDLLLCIYIVHGFSSWISINGGSSSWNGYTHTKYVRNHRGTLRLIPEQFQAQPDTYFVVVKTLYEKK